MKGVSKVIPEPPLCENQILSDLSKREVLLTSQIDALVRSRHELRKELVEGNGVEGERMCASSEGFPSFGGVSRGPIITSDIQIVPPRLERVASRNASAFGTPPPGIDDKMESDKI